MAFLGSPPQAYWPPQFVTDPAFAAELDPAVSAAASLHDNQQPQSHHIGHPHGHPGMPPPGGDPNDPTHHLMDPALSDEIPPHQGQHPIIFHQTSPHGYAAPFPDQPVPPPDQIYPGRMRAGSKDMPHNGEVMMDDGHGGAFIAPPQHHFLGNGMPHPDMQQPMGQPAQIKFRATTNTGSSGGGHGRKPKMTKEEQMARRRLRTDTDEYRTQERERMRRRRAREKEEREKAKKEAEELLRAQGKESWIAPATPTPKRKTVKMVKKKTPTAGTADEATTEDDTSRESKRQAKVDNRAANREATEDDETTEQFEDEADEQAAREYTGEDDDDEEDHDEDREGEDEDLDTEDGEEGTEEPEAAEEEEEDTAERKETRTSARRAALAKSAPVTPPAGRSTRAAAKATTPAKPTATSATSSRPVRSTRLAAEQEKTQETGTTRSLRNRSTASTPAKSATKEPPLTTPSTGPTKIATRKQTVQTPAASPSQPPIVKTRVSTKTLAQATGSTAAPIPATVGEAKSPSSVRTDSKNLSAQAPVVMLFGYPAGVNPPCPVSEVSVTVESTKTNKICMMTADDMRRPPTPGEAALESEEAGDMMDVDKLDAEKTEEKTSDDKDAEGEETPQDKPTESNPEPDLETMKIDDLPPPEKPDIKMSEVTAHPPSSPSSGSNNNNGRFSWELVVQMLKADIGFDPTKDELVGFHHKDPLLLSCDRHINTAMVMAAKEGVRMPKWYVYSKGG